MIPWQEFAQGEYVGHARAPHVPEYRLREGDKISVYYRRTRNELSRPYELEVGDRIRVESLVAGRGASVGPAAADGTAPDDNISRELVVQPDGTITLPLLGQVRATRRTVPQLRDELEEAYKKYFRVPSITVTPISVNTRLEDLLSTVDSRAGTTGGLQIQVQVTLVLIERAQRFIYVLGEVGRAGRYELEGPTTVTMALSMAEGWRPGSNLRQVVVFRRAPDWRLMATMVDVRGALYAKRPVPTDDIWLNDSDIVLVPKTPIQQVDEIIEQYLTRGVYSLVPHELIWNLDTVGSSL